MFSLDRLHAKNGAKYNVDAVRSFGTSHTLAHELTTQTKSKLAEGVFGSAANVFLCLLGLKPENRGAPGAT